MTECERITKEGILPESFFEEEVRCDFFVDKKRKKLWAVLLDILNEFDRVCRENNLAYYLCSGTLLGAIRHKGFIPWDDDIDLAMPRDDYEKLLCLSSAFKTPYLLQTPYTDEGYYLSFAKVRNINTTFASESLIYSNINQGCFIDVFPYDRFDLEGCDVLYERIKLLARCLGVALKKSNPAFVNNDVEIEKIMRDKTPIEIYDELQTLAKNAGSPSSQYITSLVSTLSRFEKKAYPVDCFRETVRVPFENLFLPVPIGYEEILTRLYGDYMQFPPVEKRGQWHSNFIYEPDISFDDYRKDVFLNKTNSCIE